MYSCESFLSYSTINRPHTCYWLKGGFSYLKHHGFPSIDFKDKSPSYSKGILTKSIFKASYLEFVRVLKRAKHQGLPSTRNAGTGCKALFPVPPAVRLRCSAALHAEKREAQEDLPSRNLLKTTNIWLCKLYCKLWGILL